MINNNSSKSGYQSELPVLSERVSLGVREAATALGVSEGLVRKWLPELPHALARMLKPFGIPPERGRVGTANPVSVYTRASFEPVWERYFPSPARRETDTTQTVRLSGQLSGPAQNGYKPDGQDTPLQGCPLSGYPVSHLREGSR